MDIQNLKDIDILGITRKNELILEETTQYGIYYDEVRTKRFTRKIMKDGTIKLNNKKYNVLNVPGVRIHIQEN